MNRDVMTVLLILGNIVLIGLCCYLFYLLKIKRTDSYRLEEKLAKLRSQYKIGYKKVSELLDLYNKKRAELAHLLRLENQENELRLKINQNEKSLKALLEEIKQKTDEKTSLTDDLLNIKSDLSIFSPTLDFINLGFFEEPQYLYETSDRFKVEINEIRAKQKNLIKDKKAILCPESIAITSNKSYAKRILNGQINLMLKAFNVECDLIIGNVKPGNFSQTLERIDKLATDIEKGALSLQCGFNKEYIELKFQECELQYQFKLKQQREREEQQIIKEQIRDEQKALREFERAITKAEKEEEMYQSALKEAKEQLALASDQEKEKLQTKISLLENNLQEALEKAQRAKSMAEQTKAGHVYIISNIGSFGENVYKIGLTRRINPEERVHELGDASVPFSFDIHALIVSQDAPALERDLHQAFTNYRVNAINYRKEFFNVTLDQIKQKAEELSGNEIDFKMTALAEEYYESKRLRKNYP